MSKISYSYIYYKIQMLQEKFKAPTEIIELPSQGKVYDTENPLSSGKVEMKYMTAREEDILTNVNLLRQGLAFEKMLQSLVVSEFDHDQLLLGDRNSLLISARVLAYGKDYSFSYRNPNNNFEVEQITIDLQNLEFKKVNSEVFKNKNEFDFTLPHSKVPITFKLLTVADDKKIDEEIKGVKKATGKEPGTLSTKLKFQITSINGDRSSATIREFVDQGQLLSIDALELRKYIDSINPDLDTRISFTTKLGEEVTMELPLNMEFFFPGIGI